jgi:hypothetical protein
MMSPVRSIDVHNCLLCDQLAWRCCAYQLIFQIVGINLHPFSARRRRPEAQDPAWYGVRRSASPGPTAARRVCSRVSCHSPAPPRPPSPQQPPRSPSPVSSWDPQVLAVADRFSFIIIIKLQSVLQFNCHHICGHAFH